MEILTEPDGFIESKEPIDPLRGALKAFFNMDYLFPYQRLVISNILEAAEERGVPIHWPPLPGLEDAQLKQRAPLSMDASEPAAPGSGEENDRGNLGQQIVILPTGAGKSLCFQLPAMLLSGPTLVIYPILSLMADQERRLREKGFSPVLLRGGQTPEEREAVWESLRSGKSRFIIANPEVLLTPQVMEKLPGLGLVHLVIDEAHCVSEWGESFRPSYLRIGEIIAAARGKGRGPLVTAFTATASATVLEKIEKYIFPPGARPQRIIGNPDRSNISYSAWGVLLRDLAVRDFLALNQRPAIVFCSSRVGTEKLARYLRNSFEDNEIKFYHAGLRREEKTAVENWFLPNPRAVLVSTCAFGMGVDKADIRTVIHRDCPPSVEAYLQESGRAGRDGKQSIALLLFGPGNDEEKQLNRSGAGRKRLEDLLLYARNKKDCRREELMRLLNYEGAMDSPGTVCCDVCESKVRSKTPGGKVPGSLLPLEMLREEAAVVDFIKRNRRLYTVNEAASLLRKAKNLKCSEHEAKELLNSVITLGKIRISRNPLWKNRLTI
jgi:ATP-dependent DNA helicase RecQ